MTMSRNSRWVLAAVFGVAWVSCALVEPMPDGPEPTGFVWLDLIAVAGLVTIVAAVVTLARGTRRCGMYGVAAGVVMVALTISCPLSGHHVTGWWTWWQGAMSGFVLLTSAVLAVVGRTRDEYLVLPAFATPVTEERTHVVLVDAPAPARTEPDVVRGWSPRAERPQPVRPAARLRRIRRASRAGRR